MKENIKKLILDYEILRQNASEAANFVAVRMGTTEARQYDEEYYRVMIEKRDLLSDFIYKLKALI